MLIGYNVLQEQSIFDLVNSFYGGFDNMYAFLKQNPQLDNINFDFNANPNTTIFYDASVLPSTPPGIPVIPVAQASTTGNIKAISQQNIFDIVAMTYGDFGNTYKLIQDNTLKNIHDKVVWVNFTYDKTLVSDDIIYGFFANNNLKVGTSSEDEGDVILQEDDTFILQEDGNVILME